MKGHIYFLHHSGFLYETETSIFIFDDYKDPRKWVDDRLKKTDKKVYFFVSHWHGDHFNPEIGSYESRASAYFLHKDCHLTLQDEKKKYLMQVGDTVTVDDFTVHMYGSTDIGGSFMIHGGGFTLFHAGDLNWWHWAGESHRENKAARDAFFHELKQIKEKDVDIAFFPVDARQAVAREWGVKQFLNVVHPQLLVPMHAFGPIWVPSYEFRWLYDTQKLWIPKHDGDSK